MPSYEDFDRVLGQGNLPEGIRDEQDCKEYMEEQSARTAEKEKADREVTAEKVEKIGTFEKRLKMNKNLYDSVAYQRARRLAAIGDDYEDYHRTDIMEQNYLLENLYNGVVDNDIDISSVTQWRYETTSGKSVDTGEIVLPNRGEDIFKRAFSGFALNSLMTPTPGSKKEHEAIDKRVKEMMDASKYEEDFDKFLEKSPEKINSYNIDEVEKEIRADELLTD